MIAPSISSLWPSEKTIVRLAKLAAALLTIQFVRAISMVLGFATEPKVSGGIDLDKPIPETTFWSPLWVPMLLAALYAYWTWPKRYDRGPVRTGLSGGLAAFRSTCSSHFSLQPWAHSTFCFQLFSRAKSRAWSPSRS
jgi:hypothetical protein